MAYSEAKKKEIIDSICNDISSGLSCRKACLKNELPQKTFYEWIDLDETKSKQYARACTDRADFIFEEAIEIADTPIEGIVIEIDDNGRTKEKKGDMLGHRKLQVDTRKWFLSKMFPKKYGEKLEIAGDGDNPLIPEQKFTPEQIDKIIDRL